MIITSIKQVSSACKSITKAMFLRIARDIAKPQTFAILDLLKRSTGLPVKELAKAMKMSYMGVKQHCTELEKKGFLDTWRRPGEVGRPEKLYRLTEKAAAFYPESGNELTLEILHSIQQIYGPSAPDKLLFNHFAKKTEAYLKKVKGDPFRNAPRLLLNCAIWRGIVPKWSMTRRPASGWWNITTP